jgi:A/G-specific adenine glycosylase
MSPVPAAPADHAADLVPADEVAEIRDLTLDWFAAHARDLPWRADDRTPYGVLVSEVMLQQTPVVRVEPAWHAWMTRWPTPADLAAAAPADVLRAWDRLGYPRRALRLRECAQAVVERHGGELPTEEAELRALPGIGEYTAAAIRAFAFGLRSTVLDTNVRRVLARVAEGIALPAPALTAAERRLAGAFVPEDDATAARWAAASMELGALVCTARSPRCDDCPVRGLCAWRSAGFPADVHAARRRPQAWAGTDRQVRGRIMALLRDALEPAPAHAVAAVWPDDEQRDRCLASLLADRLVEQVGDRYRLPH